MWPAASQPSWASDLSLPLVSVNQGVLNGEIYLSSRQVEKTDDGALQLGDIKNDIRAILSPYKMISYIMIAIRS